MNYEDDYKRFAVDFHKMGPEEQTGLFRRLDGNVDNDDEEEVEVEECEGATDGDD